MITHAFSGSASADREEAVGEDTRDDVDHAALPRRSVDGQRNMHTHSGAHSERRTHTQGEWPPSSNASAGDARYILTIDEVRRRPARGQRGNGEPEQRDASGGDRQNEKPGPRSRLRPGTKVR